MNIFLLASSYLEDTLYGMFKNITKLIMLKENHIQGLEQTIQLEYDIVLYDNILQAIHDADLILLIYDEIYSIFLKEKIAQLNVCNKKAIFLCYNRKQNKFISNVDNFRDIPTILLLEHGEYAQIEKAEFAINQALNKQNIKLYQRTSELCNLILRCNEINSYINFDSTNYDAAELQIFAVKDFHSVQVQQSSFYANFFHTIKPDIIITYIEAEYFDELDYTNSLNYRYDLRFSYISKSDYYHWDDSYIKKSNHPSCYSNNIDSKYYFPSDIDYFQVVKSILEKPEGVTIL